MTFGIGIGAGLWAIAFALALGEDGVLLIGFLAVLLFFALAELRSWRVRRARASHESGELLDFSEVTWDWHHEDRAA